MLNTLIMEGHLTRDPEMKRTATGVTIANIAIACDGVMRRNGETKTTFLRVRFFGATAENVIKFFSAGDVIIVVGRLESDVYLDKDTRKQNTMYYMAADRFEFPVRPKSKNDVAAPIITEAAMEGTPQERVVPSSPDVTDVMTDDLPF